MTDLFLHDLKNLTSAGLVQILSNEKKEMLGEKRAPATTRAVNHFCLRSVAGSVTKVSKAGGGRKCYRVKS